MNMAMRLSSDDDVERLLKLLDPLDRDVLSVEGVESARDALGDAIIREACGGGRLGSSPHASRSRVVSEGRARDVERRPRSLRRGAGRRRLGLSGAVVAAAAVGVLIAAALLPIGGSRDAPLGPTPASAAVALDRAASTAMRQMTVFPTARQYEYVKVQEGVTSSGGYDGVSVRFWQSDTRQDWYKANGSGRERIVSSREGFLGPLDRSIARARGLSLSQFVSNQDGDSTLPGGGGAYYSDYDPASLPTQPAALLRAIKREVRATRTPPTRTAGATASEVATASLFEVIADRLLFDSTSPTVRAALYRVIAHLPGVQLLGWRTDRLGRRGIAVAISHAEVGDEATRRELLFDPSTGEPLQTQLVQTASLRSPGTATLPSGTVLTYTVFINRGVVDSIEDLPGGAHLPYHPTVGGGQ
jgi:hypothetical protein